MFQKLTIAGNLGSDPEMRYLPSGQAVTNFSVASNRKWTDKATGETQKETTWFRVSVWGKQAEAANQYLLKGRQVLIEGRLKPDPDTGSPRIYARSDGMAGASYEVVASHVQFLGGGNGNGNGSEGEGIPYNGDGTQGAQEEDEIPF